MSRYESACPIEAQFRANRCEPCVASNNGVPPCVMAFLGNVSTVPASNVVPLHRIDLVSARKAA